MELQAANHPKQLVAIDVIFMQIIRLVKLVFVHDKSHLMTVIYSIDENADLLNELTNTKVRKAAKTIAGQFRVLRIEIGATTMSLRDIIFSELERFLAKFNLSFQFPAASYLDSYFSELAPEYPYFPSLVSYENSAAIAQETLRCLNIKSRSKLAVGILAALKLLDDKQ